MELSDAICLARFNVSGIEPQKWADLGCGNGLFTKALANFLPSKSLIYAVDSDQHALSAIPSQFNGVSIEKMAEDFTSDLLFPTQLDGFLMANALHYVDHKQFFLTKKMEQLQPGGLFLLIEYELEIANRWVPYPINFEKARELFYGIGFSSFEYLNEIPSVYDNHKMYAALAQK